MLTNKISFFVFALLSMAGLQAQQQLSMQAHQINPTTQALVISIPLEPNEYIYADQIQVSVNSPSITLSPWQSSIEPVMQYDPIFKEQRKLLLQSPTLRMTVTKTSPLQAAASVRLVYYTNKHKTAQEKLFTLNFDTTQASQAPAKTNEKSLDPEPLAMASEQHKEQAPQNLSWFDYLKSIATKSKLLWVRILIAFLLGLLLSLTPCIYPMIPITIGIIQAHSTKSLWRNLLLALSYTLGIATTFALLGLAAALAGHAFGSFMNNPFVILFIVALLIYSALSLFGFYEIHIPRFLQATGLTRGGTFVTTFLFGAASGTVASPCLSPGLLFMLTMVATLNSIWAGFILLFSFAIGLSIPLLIIGTFSGALALLPQAGSWMVEIKYLLGFLLLGMCFYFLATILPLSILLGAFTLFLSISGILYLYHAKFLAGTTWRLISNILGMILVASSVFFAFKTLKQLYLPNNTTQQTIWMKNYADALQKAQDAHKNLFIFVHAPRCGACHDVAERLKTKKSLENLAHVIALEVDLAQESDPSTSAIVQQFTVLGAPSCILVNPTTQQVIQRWDGELDAIQFNQMITTLGS